MALGTCRDCGLQVSTSAASCPRCGRVFSGVSQRTPTSKRFVLIVALVGIGFLAYARACSTTIPGDSSFAESQRDERRMDANLQYAAEQSVRAQLRDPESAQFRNVRVIRKPGSTAVCGEVNARNGFGGYTGYQHFMSSGDLSVVHSDETARAFLRLWNKACATS